MRAKQNAGDQQLEIFIEVLAHAFELRLIERACRIQAACEQRQPAVAARQHVRDQIHELAPALIIKSQHTIDGGAERIVFRMRQSAPRRLFIAWARVRQHRRR